MSLLIVAFYFSMTVAGQPVPVVIGPYATWDECIMMQSFMTLQGYSTERCHSASYPQIEAQPMDPSIVIPYEGIS